MKGRYNFQNLVLLAALTLIWGSSYILIKRGLTAFKPLELACIRIGLAGLTSLPIAIKALSGLPRPKYFTLLQIGLFSSGIPAFLFALSMTQSESSINGILNALSPLMTVLIGYYFYKVQITRRKIMGIAIGFAGAVVLIMGKGINKGNANPLYLLLPVLATFCYGLASNITKQKLQHDNPLHSTSIALSMVGLPACAALFFTRAPATIASGQAWFPLACIAVLSIMGTLIAWVLFYRLVQRTDALFAASVTYLIPIVAISWGILDGETLNLIQIGAMFIILAGVYFTTSNK